MKRLMRVVLLFLSLSLTQGLLFGQFKPEEIAQRPAQEEFLRTAEIVKAEPIGEGVTKPYKLTLKKDGVEMVAAWKNPKGMQLGYLEGWQYEIAAYRLDKLIGLGMIPPAVERDFRGQPGALVCWAKNKYSLLKVMDENIPIPAEARTRVDDMKYLTRGLGQLGRQRGPDPAERPLHRGLADDHLRPFPGLPQHRRIRRAADVRPGRHQEAGLGRTDPVPATAPVVRGQDQDPDLREHPRGRRGHPDR